jgi:hypothetical protein
MKKIQLILVLTFLSSALFAGQGKWENLFNGKTLDGWEKLDGAAEYTVVKGEIVGHSKVNTKNTFLATKKNYGDFILEYKIKMDTGLNSGVQIRSEQNTHNIDHVHGYQVECDDSPRAWSAGIYDESRRGWLYPLEYNQPAKKCYKRGQWNAVRVEAIGNSIRTWMNGVPCANLVDDMTSSGFIALQVHGIGKDATKEGRTICWKDIRIMTNDLEKYRKPMDKSVREVSYLNNTLTPNEVSNGWKLLWDGKTAAGWRGAGAANFPPKGWTIEDGAISPNKVKSLRGGDIVTTKKYKNFILEVDFKVTEGANSGIKYFIQSEPNKLNTSGFEFQVLDDLRHPDAKEGIDGNRTVGSLYDLVTANSKRFDASQPVKRVNAIGQWNRARIEVAGARVTHFLNGVKVLEITKGSPEFKADIAKSKFSKVPKFGEYEDGYILLQDHGDQVSFKNIKIKEL